MVLPHFTVAVVCFKAWGLGPGPALSQGPASLKCWPARWRLRLLPGADGAVEGAVDLGFFDDEAVEQQPRKGKGQQQEAAGGRPGGRGRRRAPAAAAAAQEGPEKEEQGEDEANWVQRDSKVIGEDDFEDMLREFKMQQQKQAAARRSRR